MDLIPLQFRTLRYFGLWRAPLEHQHWLTKYIWKPYVIASIISFTITLLGATKIYRDNVSEFTECLLMSITWLALCMKLFNFLWRRDSMVDLINEFRETICNPRTEDEQRITMRYRNIILGAHVLFLSTSLLSGILFSLLPLVSIVTASDKDPQLPFKAYQIRDGPVFYCITYVFQVITMFTGISIQISLDTTMSGFIMLTCEQIDICRQRFVVSTTCNNSNYKSATRHCAKHQQLIRRIASRIESFFMGVIVPQLFFSLITLCTTIYNMSKTELGVESLSYVNYLGCLICQVFFYCWFGNELKLKSTSICETIFHSDWTAMSPSDRKSLYFIMLVCQKDMSLSFHGFCPLSLEIYIWVMKTSYGAYNLLKTLEVRNG